MCGICGWAGPRGAELPSAALAAMRDVLTHRGPEGAGEWRGSGVVLGHRRLKIIDLTQAASQPMVSDDGLVALTYNGEIYNFGDLRRELSARGARFDSTGDTEVVLRAYEAWGEDAFARLDGMFWDGRRGRLVLARDRTGKKPLFYFTDGEQLVFGSEIKSVLAAPGVPRRLDEARLAEFLTFGYVPHPATLYAGIEQVPPASVVTFGRDGLQGPRRYWDVLASPPAQGELIADVRRLLDAAVERRMVADVPLGVLLSGGIDSSLVAALMRRHTADRVHSFSIGFADDASYDERAHARRVAEHLGTEHTEFEVRMDAVRLLDRLVWHHDQPFMDSSAIPTYLVCELARAHVTVALNGDGGDEVFAGYDRFRAAALAVRLPRAAIGPLRALVARMPADSSYHSPRLRLLRYLDGADRPVTERYRSWMAVAPELAHDAVWASIDRAYEEAADRPALDRILHANFSTYLPDDLAVKMDRMSMAHSLEARSPMLDTALIERLAVEPARRKVGLRHLKPVLRRAFWDELPPDIWNRRKHGFGVPVGTWFRGELGELFADEVLAADARCRDVLRQDELARMYADHRAQHAEHGHRLWTVLTLERWLRTLGQPVAERPPEPVLAAEAG
jgi:asparagine synthase (glutamine-hydrolysing)